MTQEEQTLDLLGRLTDTLRNLNLDSSSPIYKDIAKSDAILQKGKKQGAVTVYQEAKEHCELLASVIESTITVYEDSPVAEDLKETHKIMKKSVRKSQKKSGPSGFGGVR